VNTEEKSQGRAEAGEVTEISPKLENYAVQVKNEVNTYFTNIINRIGPDTETGKKLEKMQQKAQAAIEKLQDEIKSEPPKQYTAIVRRLNVIWLGMVLFSQYNEIRAAKAITLVPKDVKYGDVLLAVKDECLREYPLDKKPLDETGLTKTTILYKLVKKMIKFGYRFDAEWLNKNLPSLSKIKTADELLEEGISHKASGENKEAKKCFKEALELYNEFLKENPKDVYALLGKGKTLYMMRRYFEAQKPYNEALKLNPENTEALIGKGNVLLKLKRYKGASKAFDAALRKEKDNLEALEGKGNALLALGKKEEAKNYFKGTLGICEKMLKEKEDAFVWFHKGSAHLALGENENALNAFGEAIKLNSKFVNAWYNKGNALYNMKRGEDAYKAYEKAFRLGLDETDALVNIGNISIAMGKYELALKAFNRVLRTNKGNKEAIEGKRRATDLKEGKNEDGEVQL